MTVEFVNKVVIVTGGAKGLGRAFSLEFSRRGADVICADIDPAAGQELIRSSVEFPGRVHFVEANLGEAAACDRIAEAARNLGGLDVLCNNVGIQPAASYVPAH